MGHSAGEKKILFTDTTLLSRTWVQQAVASLYFSHLSLMCFTGLARRGLETPGESLRQMIIIRKTTHGSSSRRARCDAQQRCSGWGSALQPAPLTPALRGLRSLSAGTAGAPSSCPASTSRGSSSESKERKHHTPRGGKRNRETDTAGTRCLVLTELGEPLRSVSSANEPLGTASALAAAGALVFVRFSILWLLVSMSLHPPSQALVLGKGRARPLPQQPSGQLLGMKFCFYACWLLSENRRLVRSQAVL